MVESYCSGTPRVIVPTLPVRPASAMLNCTLEKTGGTFEPKTSVRLHSAAQRRALVFFCEKTPVVVSSGHTFIRDRTSAKQFGHVLLFFANQINKPEEESKSQQKLDQSPQLCRKSSCAALHLRRCHPDSGCTAPRQPRVSSYCLASYCLCSQSGVSCSSS